MEEPNARLQAMAEVLQIMTRTSFELQPVLEAGYEGQYQYNAIGNVAILASRLSAEAGPGDILISQRLHASVEDLVAVQPVRQVSLKGFSRPVPVYNVIALKEAPGA